MCAVCSREFYQKYQLESHKNVHDQDKEYRCAYPRCTHVYKSQGEYSRHCGEYKEYACTECDKEFTEKKNLEQHMELHSDIFKDIFNDSGGGAA